MDGRDRSAGAVAGLFGPRNPVLAARAVMERTPHVALIGSGAAAMARGRTALRGAALLLHAVPVGRPAGDAPPAGRGASVGRSSRQARHGGRGGARPCRTPGGGHVDGGHDGQDAGADGRHAGDRRGHLRRRRDLRGLRHRSRRGLHAVDGGGRDRRPDAAWKAVPGGRRAPRRHGGSGPQRRFRRRRRGGHGPRPGTSPCHSTARACTAAPSAREKSPTRQSIQAKPN